MAKTIEFLFDFGSPTTFLASRELPRIAERAGADLVWQPVLLGGILKAVGNMSPMDIPAKAAWMVRDLQRWADRYGVSFRMNPHFPVNTLFLMRGAVAMQRIGRLAPYANAVFAGLWQEGLDLADPEVLRGLLARHEIDSVELQAAAASDAVKLELRTATERAVAQGVFGCPTCFVDGEMFFGQDRLLFVEEALRGA